MERTNLIKIEITIPLNYNDKTPIEQYKFDKIKRELLREFNGLTISDKCQGYWMNDKNEIIEDIVKIYTVVTDTNYMDGQWLKSYQKWLEYESNLDQDKIFIVISEVTTT